MATANDLIVVFVALEVLSIPLYVLSALDRRRLKSQEAGMKYFLLGAFSSAIFLYGVALMYGTTGTTRLAGGPASIVSYFGQTVLQHQGMPLLALVFILVGLGFKAAAVPRAPTGQQASPRSGRRRSSPGWSAAEPGEHNGAIRRKPWKGAGACGVGLRRPSRA